MKVVNIPLEIVDSHAKFSDLAGHHIQNFGKEELCFMSNDIRMSPVVAGKTALVCICEENIRVVPCHWKHPKIVITGVRRTRKARFDLYE